jgi:hypothetical protein
MTLLAPYDEQDASAWAIRITERWRASVQAIIEVGQLLVDAKARLPHGEFGNMIEHDLPFGARTAQMLMSVASDGRLANPKHASLLPASWMTLYELTKLSDEEFEGAVKAKVIRPDMERREIAERIKPEAGPLPSGARAIMGSRQEPDDSLDFFPTPPWATRALVELVLSRLKSLSELAAAIAWEPACGEGHIAEVLSEYFCEVVASDIFDYGYGDHVVDFLVCEQLARKYDADWIITNPPFGDKSEAFVLNALKLAQVGVAMFVRLQWLETVGRYETIFRDTPPTVIAFFAERVPLCKGRWNPEGDTATAYIWLVWVKDKPPQPPFWIAPGCREALSRPDDVERFTQRPVARRVKALAA